MRVQRINKTRILHFSSCSFDTPFSFLFFYVPSGPLAHFSPSFLHLSFYTCDASLCIYRRPMSWWPLRSLRTARVSEGTGMRGGGARGIIISSLFFFLSQKMRRSRRQPFGSWRCSGPWSRTTLWSWRRLFAGEGNSTWSLNMLRGSVQWHNFTLNAIIPTLLHL